jgi:Cu(I)/Ag(I) efflux system membrane protein CusA/SilA
MLKKIIRYFIENRLITAILLIVMIGWGFASAPFGWDTGILPTDPVAVDALPDIGENQQIVFTEWLGKSPQDIEDQITYPLTSFLLGIRGVKSVRSSSIFGFSSIYLIFHDGVEFYQSRATVLEKLSAIPSGLLPDGIQPTLGPDATALGQIFWYTIEGRDEKGNATGGWDLHEIRSVQDYYVKYGLNAVEGVAEVASVGGYVQEYQIDVIPAAMRSYGISLMEVADAVKKSNMDVGAKTIEINMAEYFIRGLGNLKSIEDIEESLVAMRSDVPISIKDVGKVRIGPALRRGMLDKDGAEVVGGVVLARYGTNAMKVIENVKEKILQIAPGLPRKKLQNGTVSQLTIVPFYDRTKLINETLGTLEKAISLEILISVLVVLVMALHLRASILISSLLPLSVLVVFIAMRHFGVDANMLALSGIAIAIGTVVDLGIILSENIVLHLHRSPQSRRLVDTIYKATSEVSGAIFTAVATTLVSFIPVFTLQAAEGKLFRPLAFTKTFVLAAAIIVALLILPTVAYWFFGFRIRNRSLIKLLNAMLLIVGFAAAIWINAWAGITLIAFAAAWFLKYFKLVRGWFAEHLAVIISIVSVIFGLSDYWSPLGADHSFLANSAFVVTLLSFVLGGFLLLKRYYRNILGWCLANRKTFLVIPLFLMLVAATSWLGFSTVFGIAARGFDWIGWDVRKTFGWSSLTHTFPGLGEEFMPAIDEGSFLLMPTSMPHAGFAQNKKVLQQLDMLLAGIPEVDLAVGKMGRAESALDPAPISMYEIVINYKPEFIVNSSGRRLDFRVDEQGNYRLRDPLQPIGSLNTAISTQQKSMWTLAHDKKWVFDGLDTILITEAPYPGQYKGEIEKILSDPQSYLIEAEDGKPYRNWRPRIRTSDDIWKEVVGTTKIPGVTSAPKLQPIETRLVMLQTGLRAPMGIKVFGSDLSTIEDFAIQLEALLKTVPSVDADVVFADKIIGKPYLHLNIKRRKLATYGLTVADVQNTIEVAIGGKPLTTTVEGRERYSVRVRYPRELRDDPEVLKQIDVHTPQGIVVPLGELVDVEYEKGPQAIKSEDTFLLTYVLFDKKEGYSEVETVEDVQHILHRKIADGSLIVPAGVSYKFTGNYQNHLRAQKHLSLIIPLSLLIILIILYLHFRSISSSLMVVAGIALAFSGAFLLLWLYGQPWFMNFAVFGVKMRELFHMQTYHLSVAVWVGFIALFGIATDDGVLIGTYLDQSFSKLKPNTVDEIRNAVIDAGKRRITPAVMTSATTIIALLPILTSSGRGADIMKPMAIPAFGGMIMAAFTYFLVPVLYAIREERKAARAKSNTQDVPLS